ncbi:MAG: long-chain fatty acid--CoA ligase [Rhodospirillales bacterium]|nr:long-chain fatty acid--CoA ligase [Rhodospirillales bacterium]
MNITEPLRRLARVAPDAIAILRADDTAVTFRDLDRMIDAAASRLDGTGLVAGQVAGLAITGPDEFPALILALALARAGIASADPGLAADRMQLSLHQAGTPARTDLRSIAFDAGWTQVSPRMHLPVRPLHPGGDALCRIFSSSGTTGTAKFTAISHALIARRILSNTLSMGPPGRVHICAVNYGITMGFCAVLQTLWAGHTLVMTSPARAMESIRRHHVDTLLIAPASLAALLTTLPEASTPPPSLRTIVMGGSAMPTHLLAPTRQRLCAHIVSYLGATETGGIASAPFDLLAGMQGAVGVVHAGVEVQAVGEDDKPLPPGTSGALRIRGQNVAAGYLGADPAHAAIFRDGWFYPGDLGAVTADGVVTISGRVSDVINAGGVKVLPQVIEEALQSLPEITDAAAFGAPDAMGVVQIWAAIVTTGPVPKAALDAVCQGPLAAHPPKFVLRVDALPRNANGKIMRQELVRFVAAQQRGTAPPA